MLWDKGVWEEKIGKGMSRDSYNGTYDKEILGNSFNQVCCEVEIVRNVHY